MLGKHEVPGSNPGRGLEFSTKSTFKVKQKIIKRIPINPQRGSLRFEIGPQREKG